MLNYDLKTIAEICHGQLYGDPEEKVFGVQIDSRLCSGRELFVPFAGERVDGHDFVSELLASGKASAALWQKGDRLPPAGNIVVVDDTLKALQDLASFYRRNSDAVYIGVTGSSGKTSTKDIIAAVLSRKYRVHKTQGNKNNEIGVPLTILQAPEGTQYCVVEMGISDFNEMEPMADLVRPDMTVITCIAEAHIMNFRDMDNTSKEKCKINSRLGNGQCFYAINGYHLKQNLEAMNLINPAISYGFEDGADIEATDYRLSAKGSQFHCNLYPGFDFSLKILGRHQVLNSLSAIGIAHKLGFDAETIQQGFDDVKLTAHRLQLREIREALVIDDTYNANPASMTASLQTVIDYQTDMRKIAVLGDMLELGENEMELHASLADRVDLSRFDAIYLYGDVMSALNRKLVTMGIKTTYINDFTKLRQAVSEELTAGTMVLFKASNGMHFATLIDELEEM